ncbi:MAG: hypothetical protein ABJO67_03540 [Pseudoruegeria sp.]
MNQSFQPIILKETHDLEFAPFTIPMQLNRRDVELVEPLWKVRLNKSIETPTLGNIRFQITGNAGFDQSEITLKIKAGNHTYYVLMTSDAWLASLMETFEDGFDLEGHEDIAALALEGQFLSAITKIELYLGDTLSFVELSTSGYEDLQDFNPKAHFQMSGATWGTMEITIVPTSEAGSAALIDLITHHSVENTETKNVHKNVTLSGSLIASATEITRDQLHKLQPGDGFMINSNLVEMSSLNLVIADETIATVKKNGEAFEIQDLLVKPPTIVQAPEPTRKSSRTRRRRRESNT